MNIGMILDKEFPPDPRVENEALCLVNNGFKVYLFCLTYSKAKPKIQNYKGINIVRFPSNSLVFKLSALVYTLPLYSLIMFFKIKNFLKKYDISIIHIHDLPISQAVFWANQAKLPIVLDLHENRPEIMKYYPHVNSFMGKLLISPKRWKVKEEYFIKKSNKIIVVTEEAKHEILERTKIKNDKVISLPNTVMKSFFTDISLDSSIVKKFQHSFNLVYIGDTGVRRGLLEIIEAIQKLKNSIENICLVIVGSNSYADVILKKKVEELQLDNYVTFEGWKDESKFQSYINISNICISPLHKNMHHNTTFANKLFQYMSLGKPVLVSDATAQKNLVLTTKSGLVHKEKDPEDFANKVLELYYNKNLADELGKNGKEFVRTKFNWDVTSQELINMYKDFERK